MEDYQISGSETKLTPEQIAESDLDIQIIDLVGKISGPQDLLAVVYSGYAVEALCGGKITRPHGDVDIHLFAKGGFNREETSQAMADKLKDELGLNFEVKYPPESPKRAELWEEASGQDIGERRSRKIDFYFSTHDVETQEATLIDSSGKSHSVLVPPAEDLAAEKIWMQVTSGKPRPTKGTDDRDLVRLVSLPNFDKQKCLDWLAYVIVDRQHEEIVEPQKAQERANEFFENQLLPLNKV